MNLLDMFRKSKRAPSSDYIGRMWVCVVKFQPWSDPGQRYAAAIKNVGVVEVSARCKGAPRVVSDEQNLFRGVLPLYLTGPVGHLEYVSQSWVGFFETEDEAKEEYRKFADALVAEIKSA